MNQENPLFCTSILIVQVYKSTFVGIYYYVVHTLKKTGAGQYTEGTPFVCKKLVLNLNKTSLDAGV